MKRLSMAVAFLVLLGGMVAHADTMPYSDPAGQGIQIDWGGNLALRFNVAAPVTVTELGVFNASGSGTIIGPIEVAIFDTTSNTLVTPVVTFQGSYTPGALGFDVFQTITPVVLEPGSYEVDAVGFGPSDPDGNLTAGSSSGPILNDDAGRIIFTGASYNAYGGVLNDPTTDCWSCSPIPALYSQFDAGTFGLAAVPEPSVFSLLACGFASMVTWRLRRGFRDRKQS
jgi:hypothetical protein